MNKYIINPCSSMKIEADRGQIIEIIDTDGSIEVCPPLSKTKDKIVLEVLTDVSLGIAACSVSESSCNSGKCTAIEVTVK